MASRSFRHSRARPCARRRRPDASPLPRPRSAGRRQDDAGLAVLARGSPSRRARPLHHALRDRRRGAPRRAVARLVSRRGGPLRAVERRADAPPRRGEHAVRDGGGRAQRDDARAPRRGRAHQARARRLRLALRDPDARAVHDPLSPAAARAQAVFHRPQVHGAPPRRSDGRPREHAGGEPRARDHHARGGPVDLRRGAAAHPHHEAPRRELPIGLPRYTRSSPAASSSTRASSRSSTAPISGRSPSRPAFGRSTRCSAAASIAGRPR